MNNLVGLQIGRFKVAELLGTGTFAVVYRAFDLKARDNVALKLLRTELIADHDLVKQFTREGVLASRLEHPNLIKVHEIGELYGQPYHLMRSYDGRTLDHLLREFEVWQVTAIKLCQILAQAAAGLDYLHKLRIVHRDLKPNNILVLADGCIKLLDFGLSLELFGSGFKGLDHAGTVRYMAPEQAKGEPLTVQSDIYAFGVILRESFEALKINLPEPVRMMIDTTQEKDPRLRPRIASKLIEEVCKALTISEHESS